jgi:hypothetical protein
VTLGHCWHSDLSFRRQTPGPVPARPGHGVLIVSLVGDQLARLEYGSCTPAVFARRCHGARHATARVPSGRTVFHFHGAWIAMRFLNVGGSAPFSFEMIGAVHHHGEPCSFCHRLCPCPSSCTYSARICLCDALMSFMSLRVAADKKRENPT